MTTPTAPAHAPLPPEMLAKATGAIKAYATSKSGRDADVYFDADNIARIALRAVDVPGLIAENEQFRVSASQLRWLGELPADERARLIKIYFGDFTKIEQERDEAQRAAALHRDMDHFNHALLEKARAEIDQLRTEQADNLRAAQSIAAELVAQQDEARAALAFLMRDVDAVAGVSNKDRYDFAVDVARERGHEEPTAEDELDGFLRLITEARRVLGSKEGA